MNIDTATLKRSLPTLFGFVERRQSSRKNRLPKHLLPPTLWGVYFQLGLNVVLIIVQLTMMMNKDDYLTEVGPAIPMTVSLLFLLFSVGSAMHLRHQFYKGRGERLSKLNFALMILAVLAWTGTVASFL